MILLTFIVIYIIGKKITFFFFLYVFTQFIFSTWKSGKLLWNWYLQNMVSPLHFVRKSRSSRLWVFNNFVLAAYFTLALSMVLSNLFMVLLISESQTVLLNSRKDRSNFMYCFSFKIKTNWEEEGVLCHVKRQWTQTGTQENHRFIKYLSWKGSTRIMESNS